MVYVVQVLTTACKQDKDGTRFHPDPARKCYTKLYSVDLKGNIVVDGWILK